MKDRKIIEKIFIRDRWHVRVEPSFNGRKTIPFSHYVWLEGNPAFEDIPKGYVIHHLDYDETNDDISNLVLMQKHHHVSHHWKNKKTEVPINLDHHFFNKTDLHPITEPKKYQFSYGAWFVQFHQIVDGKKKLLKITRYKGEVMKSEETASECERNLRNLYNGLKLLDI